jgi:hypothetical protein
VTLSEPAQQTAHGAQFNVWTGAVLRGPAKDPLKTYRVTMLFPRKEFTVTCTMRHAVAPAQQVRHCGTECGHGCREGERLRTVR